MVKRRITLLSLLATTTVQHSSSLSQHDEFIGNTRKRHRRSLLRGLQQTTVSQTYLTSHPWYPSHDLLQCIIYTDNTDNNNNNDPPIPIYMTYEGGYAESHLFSDGAECCQKWFPEQNECFDYVENNNNNNNNNANNNQDIVMDYYSSSTTGGELGTVDDDDLRPRPIISSAEGAANIQPIEQQQTSAAIELLDSAEATDYKETIILYDDDEILAIDRADKTEVVGIPPLQSPTSSSPPPAPSKTTTTTTTYDSPYTISTTTFGPLSVASDSCGGGCPISSTCVGNSASGQLIADSECAPCADTQTWWPCDVHGLCWCHANGTPRIAPAPSSGIGIDSSLSKYYTICDDILTPELFHKIAPNANEPYTYTALCDAILTYNAAHSEKIFGHGTIYQRVAELAAFIGNTLHESDEYQAPREYLMCADNKNLNGEVYCKPCDPGSFNWTTKKCSHSLVSGTSDFNEYCQPSSVPPEACKCGVGSGESSSELEGYVAAKHLYFGRGAIQLSWNYNYIGASVALTGSADTFCDNPDVVATEGRYAWGAGIYFWMEHVKEETTSHIEALIDGGDFGGTLNNINGGLECPAHGGWHVDAVKARLNRYCRAAKVLGLPNLMRLDNCAGLQESLETCLGEGKCDDCHHYVGTSPGVVVDNYVPPASAPVSITVEVEPEARPVPLCSDGLMPWEGNSDCCVPNSAFVGDGACDPEAPYNTAVCGYDGGDCCVKTCNQDSAFGCTTKESSDLERYGPFGFFCIDPNQGEDVINSLLCDVEERYRIGDGKCNPSLNMPECNYDGGDCCEETCSDTFAFYPCGSSAHSYECIDPKYKTETTNAPTSSPQKIQQDTDMLLGDALANMCPMDMLECPNGQYISRNPDNKCHFDPCPEELFQETPEEEVMVVQRCEPDLKECQDGAFVSQDPMNDCKFYPCKDEIIQEQSATGNEHSLASSIALAMHGKNNYMLEVDEPLTCDEDLKECGGGKFVGRDPANMCKFFECQHSSTLANSISSSFAQQGTVSAKVSSSAASITSSFADSTSKNDQAAGCTKELKRCPDGTFVGQDPVNNCAWYECSTLSSSISAFSEETIETSIASMIHSKYNTQVNSVESESVWQCAQDLFICPDGSHAGRDVANSCKFFRCSDDDKTMKQVKKEIYDTTVPSSGSLHKKGNY